MKQISWLPWAALCLLAAACGSLGHASSGDVLERLHNSGHVDRADRQVCQHTTPDGLISGDPPTVLATDRVTYKEVTDAMRARGLDEVLKLVPKLPADAAVTLCLMDTRGVPAAHATRVTYAVSRNTIWVADGQFE